MLFKSRNFFYLIDTQSHLNRSALPLQYYPIFYICSNSEKFKFYFIRLTKTNALAVSARALSVI